MTTRTMLLRSALAAALAMLLLAGFGELRFGAAAFLMITVVLTGLALDVAAYRRTT